MIIEKQFADYCIASDENLTEAFRRIEKYREGVLLAVNQDGHVEGLLTIGDLIRFVASSAIDVSSARVDDVMNRHFISASEKDNRSSIADLLEKFRYVPILDDYGRLSGIARSRKDFEHLIIDGFSVSEAGSTFIIAEIGINHNGSLERAKTLIDLAIDSGADCVKFQMRDMGSLYRQSDASGSEDLGSEYVKDLLSRSSLSNDDMAKAFHYANEKGILPLCTPWDSNSLKFLEDYGMPAYKVASADLTNHPFLTELASTGKPLLCSTGMSTEQEIIEAIAILQTHGVAYALLHTNSTYPSPFKDLNLLYLHRLREIGRCIVGYSGHERGFHIPIAAVSLGARVIEKHFTLDRSLEGNDHKVSLLPGEFGQMVRQIRELESSLGTVHSRKVSQGEIMNRINLAKSIVSRTDIAEGTFITASMVEVKSPGRGLQPNRIGDLIGRRAKRIIKKGDFFYPSDLMNEISNGRSYKMNRIWGVPVRFHDFRGIMESSNPDFLEFHLSYKDMELPLEDYFSERLDMGLVVHSPDLFAADHILNLASKEEAYRRRSVHELQRVVDLTTALARFFQPDIQPRIVASLGGFTRDRHVDFYEKNELYALIMKSLSEIDPKGVLIMAQTLPPFPWYLGGQLYLNLFVEAEDTLAFCEEYQIPLCLDVCHSKMSVNYYNASFSDFIRTVGKWTQHLHIADAKGIDGEGLQIGEGEIDFPALARDLDSFAPNASFIPEIWMGHRNKGEGFWEAMEKLEGLF